VTPVVGVNGGLAALLGGHNDRRWGTQQLKCGFLQDRWLVLVVSWGQEERRVAG
jgi:hypothetical protein